MSVRLSRHVTSFGSVVPVSLVAFALLALLGFACCGCKKSEVGGTPAGGAAAPAGTAGGSAADSSSPSNSAAALAAGKLAGLYVRQQSIPLAIGGRITFNLRRDFYYFFPDGHVFFGVPADGAVKEHPTAADFAPFKDAPPQQRGTYLVKGGEITITPDGGKATTEPFSLPKPGDDSVLQIGPPSVVGSVKALPFPDGQKLDGSYQFDGTVGLGNPKSDLLVNVKTLTFKPDGTLGSDLLSGVDTHGIDTAVGNSGVTTAAQSASAGSYHFSGYTLQTTLAGKTEKATAFRYAGDALPSPGLLYISGRIYSRQDAKK